MCIFLLLCTSILAEEITLENQYFKQIWTLDNNKISTKQIVNKRTDGAETVIVPGEGIQEFVIALPGDDSQVYPSPIDKSNFKIAYANSENSASGNEGPASNLLDNNAQTIWHTYYGGGSGHDDRDDKENDPFYFIVDTQSPVKFQSISYQQRPNGGNGAVKDFQLYVGSSQEEVQQKIKDKQYELDDTFIENHGGKCYVNLTHEIEAQFIAIVTKGDGKYASGAEFDIYAEPLPATNYVIQSSDLTHQKHTVEGKKLVITYEPYEFRGATWNINEIVEMENDKHYLHKHLEIKCSDKSVQIDYIDLEHIKISAEDLPFSWGTPMVENVFKNLGQPFYLNTVFFGCRFPLAHTLIERKVGRVRYYTGKRFEQFETNADGYYVTWQTVTGVARSNRMEVVRNDFFSYIADISVPSPFRKQYNSWYDWMLEITEENIMVSFKEIEKGCSQFGLPPFDSYVIDDGWNNYNSEKYDVFQPTVSGTTYNEDGFWTFNNKFPNKFTPPSKFTKKISSYFGVWLGPRGGYATPGQFGKMIEDAGKGFYAPDSNDVDVASHKYVENVKNLLCSFIRDYQVNYYKLDGFTATPCSDTTHDHMVGGQNGMYFFTDLWESWIAAYKEMIQTAKDVGLTNFWISSTTFTNLSPFHLQWSNSVWIQISGDMGETIVDNLTQSCDQVLTYRDQCYWSFYDEREFQFPAKNLYNHDPIYGQAGTTLRGSMDDDYFRTFLSGCAMRGTMFWELYYTYDMIDEGDKWYVNSDVLSWTEKNKDILQHSQRFGGQPAKGEVYGYSAWEGNNGIISFRNPSGSSKEFTLILDRDAGVTEGLSTVYRSTRLQHLTFSKEENVNGVPYNYGDELKVTLQAGEYRIYEFAPQIDEKPPVIEVVKTTKENELTIRFDKYVDLTNAKFTVEGLTVKEAKLRGDLRTVRVEFEDVMTNYTIYKLSIEKVASIFGVCLDTELEFQYYALNIISSIRGEFSGTGQPILSQIIKTDSFTFKMSIKDLNGLTNCVLLHSEDNSIVAEIVNKHVKFTVGDVSLTSEGEVSDKSSFITLVRERNALIKIYIGQELDSSKWNEKMPLLETLQNIILDENNVVYNYVQIYNYGLGYDEIPIEIPLKNQFIERVFTITNEKLATYNTYNLRASDNSVFKPNPGSEEWAFTVPAYAENTLKGIEETAIDRSKWTIKANSEQSNVAQREGAAVNLIDGNPNTIWHSKYSDAGQGGHDDRKSNTDPFIITINLGEPTSFKAFSHKPRKEMSNGVIYHYEIYAADSEQQLEEAINNKEYKAKGDFKYLGTSAEPVYVNFTEEITAQFLAFVDVIENTEYGSGADFSLYKEFVPPQYHEFKSSDASVESYKLETPEEGLQRLTFTFNPVTFNKVDYTVREVYELYDDKPYMEKQVFIRCSNPTQRIVYIDLESFNLSASDLKDSWTHPNLPYDEAAAIPPFLITLGQPVYINTIFTGCRFPLNDNAIEDGVARLRYHTGKLFNELTEGTEYACWKTVFGVARSNRREVVRNDFFSYIADISVKTPLRLQYNSWYDWMLAINEENILESFKEIERGCSQFGVPPLDSYVVDDGWNNYNTEKYDVYDEEISGTTYNQGGFWEFNNKFPEGLTNPSDFARRIASNFGVWLGPRGGYRSFGQFGHMIEDAGFGYYNAEAKDIDVGSAKYQKKLGDFLNNWIKEYKINYFKLDGFAKAPCSDPTHDHATGGLNGANYYTDLWERFYKIFEMFRGTAEEEKIYNFWISITCYVNPSPFHLQWANSVWIQVSDDIGYIKIGEDSSLLDQVLTYRDNCYYKFYDYFQFQFPQRCIYNHDPIYGKWGTPLEGAFDDEQFRTFLYMCAMRGNAFFELYYTYTMLDEGDKWYINAEVLTWLRSNFETLQHSQRFGGDPGEANVYGYSAWGNDNGFIAIRNPSTEVKSYTITINRDIGVPEDIPTTYRKAVLTHETIEDIEEGKETNYGDQIEVTLQPREARIIAFQNTRDAQASQIELIRPVSNREVSVRFDKRITLNEDNFKLSRDIKIQSAALRGDLRTVTLHTETPFENNTEYTLQVRGLKDQLGNKNDSEIKFTYIAGNMIVTVPDPVTGNSTSLNDVEYTTDSFSIQLDINSHQATDGVLLSDGNNKIQVELVNNHVKFIVDTLSVESASELPQGNVKVTLVRERNTMIKIYINGVISSSAYQKDIPSVMHVKTFDLANIDVEYNSLFVVNYGLTYKDSLELNNERVLLHSATASASSSEEGHAPRLAIDDNKNTYWVSSNSVDNQNEPQELLIELDRIVNVTKLEYVPGQEGALKKYKFSISTDNLEWTDIEGEFSSNYVVDVNAAAKFIKVSGDSGEKVISVAELYLYGKEANNGESDHDDDDDDTGSSKTLDIVVIALAISVVVIAIVLAIIVHKREKLNDMKTTPLISQQ